MQIIASCAGDFANVTSKIGSATKVMMTAQFLRRPLIRWPINIAESAPPILKPI